MRHIIIVLFAMLAMACSAHKGGAASASSKPDVQVLFVHADMDFEPWERAAIMESAGQWETASRGHIQLLIQFDTDFTNEEEIDRLDGSAVLVKGNSHMGLVRAVEQDMDGTLLGVTIPRGHASIVVLVADRLGDPLDFVGVATHELGHALGMPDLEEEGHVMSGYHQKGVCMVDAVDVATCRKYSACP